MSERQQALKNWVFAVLSELHDLSVDHVEITDVAGDASFRRYFRIEYQGQTYIVMDAPPELENSTPFVKIASTWFLHGVRVPEILAHDLQQGFLLLEDFGDRLFYSRLGKETVDGLYNQAMNVLYSIQKLPADNLPLYDSSLLMREMALFRDWFLPWLGIELSDELTNNLTDVETILVRSALEQPQVVVHRDYHSRNLMLLPDGNVGVIDFQDAVVGAATYDLVSLLRDSYVCWPENQVQSWVCQFYASSPWCQQMSLVEFRRAFDWMGMQRQLKVCGIFVRLCQRDGKAAYLKDIPLTFRNLMQSAERYSEFSSFTYWLKNAALPALVKHSSLSDLPSDFWYRS